MDLEIGESGPNAPPLKLQALFGAVSVDSAISSERSPTRILSAKKVSSGLYITAPGDLVDDFHHVEGLDLLL